MTQSHAIHIKEIRPDGHLQDVASKSDFGAKIRHANVVDGSGERVTSGMDVCVKEERQDADLEMLDSGSTDESDKETEEGVAKVPPQILVLTLGSGDLLFVFAIETPEGGIDFHTSPKPLPIHEQDLERVGDHIAVDPR